MKILKYSTAPSGDLNKYHGLEVTYQIASANSYTNCPITAGHFFTKILDKELQNNLQYAVDNNNLWVRKTVCDTPYTPFSGGVGNIGWKKIHTEGSSYASDFNFDQTASKSIGKPNLTVNNLYMQNAVTVVSDEKYKTEIQAIPDAVLDVWATVNFQMYKLNAAVAEKGNDARFHFGVIAQRIKEAFDKADIDYNLYGLLTYSKWDAIQAVEYKPATYDEKGNQLTPEIQAIEGREAGEIYMVRYDEVNIIESAYQRRKIKQLEDRIAVLEAKA